MVCSTTQCYWRTRRDANRRRTSIMSSVGAASPSFDTYCSAHQSARPNTFQHSKGVHDIPPKGHIPWSPLLAVEHNCGLWSHAAYTHAARNMQHTPMQHATCSVHPCSTQHAAYTHAARSMQRTPSNSPPRSQPCSTPRVFMRICAHAARTGKRAPMRFVSATMNELKRSTDYRTLGAA